MTVIAALTHRREYGSCSLFLQVQKLWWMRYRNNRRAEAVKGTAFNFARADAMHHGYTAAVQPTSSGNANINTAAIKLVISDIDGTLVTHDKVLTAGAIDAVKRIREAGY